jgi:glyoxylase-like metal-dependent hydrolase (beta-lactamase superfamily II)
MSLDSYSLHHLKVRFSLFRNFVYIIVDTATRQAAVVDPSWELDKILAAIADLDVRVEAILLTHAHYDHVHNVEPLVRLFGAPVYMSGKEIEFYDFQCMNLHAVNHRETIKLGDTDIVCLHTPGHTAGSSSYLLSKSLFTGDTVFTEGCGICCVRGGSPEEMFDTVQMLKADIPPDVRVFPAHSYGKKPGRRFGDIKEENVYFLIERKEDFVQFRMRKNQRNPFNFR